MSTTHPTDEHSLDLDANRINRLLDEHGGPLDEAIEAAIDCYCWHDDADDVVEAYREGVEP